MFLLYFKSSHNALGLMLVYVGTADRRLQPLHSHLLPFARETATTSKSVGDRVSRSRRTTSTTQFHRRPSNDELGDATPSAGQHSTWPVQPDHRLRDGVWRGGRGGGRRGGQLGHLQQRHGDDPDLLGHRDGGTDRLPPGDVPDRSSMCAVVPCRRPRHHDVDRRGGRTRL